MNCPLDMKNTFLDTFNEKGTIDEGNVSVEALGQFFGPLKKQVRENIFKSDCSNKKEKFRYY